jgi:hypothetical protein
MNTAPPPLTTPPSDLNPSALESTVVASTFVSPSLFRKIVEFILALFLGAICTQAPLFALILVGWTYRSMQRSVLKKWWKGSSLSQRFPSFESTMFSFPLLKRYEKTPAWILKEEPAPSSPSQFLVFRWLSTLFHSLFLNFKIGIQGIFNTGVLTLPAAVCWLAAWQIGWTISFNKVYEQAQVGTLIGFLGVLLFIVAMLYVPLGQARQAISGNWRRFYDFRLNWKIARSRWWILAGIAVFFSLAALPLNLLKTLPGFFPQIFSESDFSSFSDQKLLDILNAYFFWTGMLCAFLYRLLYKYIALSFGSTLLHLVQKGEILPEQLDPKEREILMQLELLESPKGSPQALLPKMVQKGVHLLFVGLSLGLAVLLWFTFVTQIFVAEFLMYHQMQGWLNQPLVQLPWFRYIPEGLEQQTQEQKEQKE